MTNPTHIHDTDLAKYYTDLEPLRGWFDQAITAQALPKRLLVIWGVGGIGKSSVLRMFRLNARNKKISVGLASGDEAKSAVDVLARWADDLKVDGTTLPTFSKTYDHYRAIQAKVEDKANEAREGWGKTAGKVAEKTGEAVGGAALGAVVGSVIPGVGTAAGALVGGIAGSMGAEALADWLRGFLPKPDIDLYTDPTKKLTDDFLADVDKVAPKQRIVLMLDTYEQMTALDGWTREVAQRLNANVLLVIAGRAMVNWGREWSSWLMYAQVEELKPMTKRVMHELIRKYYATLRGGEPDPKQVNAIIEFSGGLPMVVNTAVQLWVKYGVEDFGAVKGEVVKAVVERLREGVSTELYPLLETAAALRYFNKDILRTVSGMGDISAGYEELLRFPFVRRRAEGYALHDRVREMIEENVRTDDPTKYRNVHERAAAYFAARLENAPTEEAQRFGLEQLYHLVAADEEKGFGLFQTIAEGQVRYRLANQLRTLVGDVSSYRLDRKDCRDWVNYYRIRLLLSERQYDEAERDLFGLLENNQLNPMIRAYALSDLATIRQKTRYVSLPGGFARLSKLVEQSNELLPNSDPRSVLNLVTLAGACYRTRRIANALTLYEQALNRYKELDDIYGVCSVYGELMKLYALQGNWFKFDEVRLRGMDLLPENMRQSNAYTRMLGGWVIVPVWMGRFREGEGRARARAEIKKNFGEIDSAGPIRDIGLALGFQGRIDESEELFSKAEGVFRQAYNEIDAPSLTLQAPILIRCGLFARAEENLLIAQEADRKLNTFQYLPEILYWIGEIRELTQRGIEAKEIYLQALNCEWAQHRYYFKCAALTGLTRVHHAQSNYPAIPPLLTEAEQLAQQYEYNDHLASLRLTQGHIAWDGHIPEWGSGFDAAFGFYKLALVYALRYNRFLLDEVLSGRPQGTPLRPIIPECLKRGEDGRNMLLALREWWQTGTNDVGTPRPDTISPLPEGIALLEAEKIAREREPGDGSAQTGVVERIDAALVR